MLKKKGIINKNSISYKIIKVHTIIELSGIETTVLFTVKKPHSKTSNLSKDFQLKEVQLYKKVISQKTADTINKSK